MTQTLTHRERPLSGPQAPAAKEKKGFFGTIFLFLRQVIGELRKVVTPTRKELFRYTVTVVAFVAFMILFVTLVDLGFGSLSRLIFTGPIGDN
ncbi:preprotein translocase, SecE subunit (plasmid) [Pseudarthrobacter chlorophenolicus A6]|uniref:Protein translocase subunit SecE n=1 Tax=Pseudarthrobacter chlorophenolicus (strain ATCC 700700 / DSM 12829 / CIP 107037 / JCM 12360 / KCTC 9906 / NCIMB 13794 / A6) TaxID=452863 RepID=B8HHR0_PSECP|nr:preprotein translocase subunit SecE [Pseudarthrobacter chlorophenolicus]ACL41957.1 preprotein translocase, SecE subunit [Pseudarthrobacter chlorophenolicus A6]SDQ19443.1 preprotein translocase subunit SecE [Pseudarthrobacter chlorophenolicus]